MTIDELDWTALRRFIDDNRIGRSDLAREMRLNPSQISRWLNSDTEPRQSSLKEMRRALRFLLGEGEPLATSALQDLPRRWLQRAKNLRELAAAEGAAVAFERAASELEAALRADVTDLLTLAAASQVCGFTADHLGRLVREGTIPNLGRKNAPRVRRSDLPMKTRARAPEPTGRSRQEIAREVVARHIAENRRG